VCPQVWIAGHEGPPWRADPILSWFSFQSSESEFSHGVGWFPGRFDCNLTSRRHLAMANLDRLMNLTNGKLPAPVGGSGQRK